MQVGTGPLNGMQKIKINNNKQKKNNISNKTITYTENIYINIGENEKGNKINNKKCKMCNEIKCAIQYMWIINLIKNKRCARECANRL